LTEEIDDSDLERFLEPLLVEWNGLAPEQLRALRAAPLTSRANGRVSYVSEERTPYGYQYVQLEIRNDPIFAMRLQLEGQPGDLSMEVYLPVVTVEGDVEACAEWVRTGRSRVALRG
jgi:hypothetical protein